MPNPRAAFSAADLLHLASELDTVVLNFPQQPDDEMQAAARVLQAACLRAAAASVSTCSFLRLPEEVFMKVLRELKAKHLAAVAATCRAVNEGSPSLINRGAQSAVAHQYSAELAALPPKGMRAQGQLRWLEGAAIEAQRWLLHVGPHLEYSVRNPERVKVTWPKAHGHDGSSSNWLEAVARFAAGGRDPTVYKGSNGRSKPGKYAREGVRASLLFLTAMASQTATAFACDRDDYDAQEGKFPTPGMTMGLIRWVAAQVPTLDFAIDLPLVQVIAQQLLRICKDDWKTRDWCNMFLTEGNEVVFRTYQVKEHLEPLLRAILAALSAAHGAEDDRTLSARLDLGEVLASAACVQECADKPGYKRAVRWGEVPDGNAEAVLAEALTTVRWSGHELTSPLAVRTFTARAGWLAQRGLFADAAILLREVLEAFIQRDGGYTVACMRDDHGLAHQIQCVVRHTRKQPPASNALLEGCKLLQAHLNALPTLDGGHTEDSVLLLSHLRRVQGGAMLLEAEALARELLANREHAWDLHPQAKLLKVLAAQAALGWDGKAKEVQECRAELCSSMIAELNSLPRAEDADQLFGSCLGAMQHIGYYHDGSGHDLNKAMKELFRLKSKFLREHGLVDEVEARQKALLHERKAAVCQSNDNSARETYHVRGRLVVVLLVQGKFDAAMDELIGLTTEIEKTLGVIDRLAKNARNMLQRLNGRLRNVEGELICTAEQMEAVLRNRIAACQRSAQGGTEATDLVEDFQTLPEMVLYRLTDTAERLVNMLVDKRRSVGEIESAARLVARAGRALVNVVSTSADDIKIGDDISISRSA